MKRVGERILQDFVKPIRRMKGKNFKLVEIRSGLEEN
jgi:hypothetical protein